MGDLRQMDVGMWPLNHCSKLVKMASDIMFSVSVNDADSAEARLKSLESIIADLRQSIAEHR